MDQESKNKKLARIYFGELSSFNYLFSFISITSFCLIVYSLFLFILFKNCAEVCSTSEGGYLLPIFVAMLYSFLIGIFIIYKQIIGRGWRAFNTCVIYILFYIAVLIIFSLFDVTSGIVDFGDSFAPLVTLIFAPLVGLVITFFIALIFSSIEFKESTISWTAKRIIALPLLLILGLIFIKLYSIDYKRNLRTESYKQIKEEARSSLIRENINLKPVIVKNIIYFNKGKMSGVLNFEVTKKGKYYFSTNFYVNSKSGEKFLFEGGPSEKELDMGSHTISLEAYPRDVYDYTNNQSQFLQEPPSFVPNQNIDIDIEVEYISSEAVYPSKDSRFFPSVNNTTTFKDVSIVSS